MQVLCSGGPGGDRTHDLCVANAALSQLSYKPINMQRRYYITDCIFCQVILKRILQFLTKSNALLLFSSLPTDKAVGIVYKENEEADDHGKIT